MTVLTPKQLSTLPGEVRRLVRNTSVAGRQVMCDHGGTLYGDYLRITPGKGDSNENIRKYNPRILHYSVKKGTCFQHYFDSTASHSGLY